MQEPQGGRLEDQKDWKFALLSVYNIFCFYNTLVCIEGTWSTEFVPPLLLTSHKYWYCKIWKPLNHTGNCHVGSGMAHVTPWTTLSFKWNLGGWYLYSICRYWFSSTNYFNYEKSFNFNCKHQVQPVFLGEIISDFY